MTLPSNGKKLTDKEAESMQIALKEAGIRAIHPERMEAFAEQMVEKLKQSVPEKGWRKLNALDD